ncbi:MAG: protease inhibitor I42 family protein [Candidatus Ratteibacteria bacterium]
MKILYQLCLAGILGMFIISGCVQKEIAFSVSLSEENKMETELSVKTGDVFKIELESNATTGYQWFVKYDHKFLNLKKSEYVSPVSQKLVGSPGKQIFVFNAVKNGETNIEFTYKRYWEKDKLPAKTIVYKIRIVKD